MKLFNNGRGNNKVKPVIPQKPDVPNKPEKPEKPIKPDVPNKPEHQEPIEGMNLFIGVKVVNAQPMMKHDAISIIEGDIEEEFKDENEQDEIMPYNEIDDDEIEDDEEGYLVVYENGYVSWSPKEVFEKAYHLIKDVDFETAIKILERVKKSLKFK